MAKMWLFHVAFIVLVFATIGTDPVFGHRVAVLTVLFYLVGVFMGFVIARYKELTN